MASKKKMPLDEDLEALDAIRNMFRSYLHDDTTFNQEVLLREAIRKLDSVIALMKGFKALQ